jgi:hypothetical protein
MTSSSDNRITLSLDNGNGETAQLTAGLVIAGVGQEANYEKVSNPLWHSLVHKRQAVVPHHKTGRGIEVGPYGELIDVRGVASETLFAIGPMRQGDEMQRRGRLGAFVFSIGTLRNQCFETAGRVLDGLEYPHTALDQTALETADPDAIARVVAKEMPNAERRNMHQSALGAAKLAVAMCLSDRHLTLEKESLRSRRTIEKQRAEARLTEARAELSRILTAQTGLPEVDSRGVIELASRYGRLAAMHQLTDVAYLAEAWGRVEQVITA